MNISKENKLQWDTSCKQHILVGSAEYRKEIGYVPVKKNVVSNRNVNIQDNQNWNVLWDRNASVSVRKSFPILDIDYQVESEEKLEGKSIETGELNALSE